MRKHVTGTMMRNKVAGVLAMMSAAEGFQRILTQPTCIANPPAVQNWIRQPASRNIVGRLQSQQPSATEPPTVATEEGIWRGETFDWNKEVNMAQCTLCINHLTVSLFGLYCCPVPVRLTAVHLAM